MIPKHRIPSHPGEILLEEFLRPAGLFGSREVGSQREF